MGRTRSRRRWLTTCSSGVLVAIAGCTGSGDDGDDATDDATDDDGEPGTPDTDDTDDDGNGEAVATGGTTLAHTPQTGRYEFFGEGLTGVETLVWDVQETDGEEATVEATVHDTMGGEMSHTITTAPIFPESATDGRLIGDGYDVDDITDARFGELWFPIHGFGDVDLSSLSVDDEWDGAGSGLTVTDTDSHAGLDCLVVEETVVGELTRRFCVSAEHAMVVHGERLEGNDEPDSVIGLTSYDA